jgi:hypothetical protein
MLRTTSTLLGAACCLGLWLPSSATAGDCQPKPGREPIRVNVGADGKPTVSEDTATFCQNEQVRWVFTGPGGKEFSIVFRGAEGSPFDWDRQTGNTVTGTVRAGAAKDGNSTDYKYDVEIDGEVLDPVIVVEP